MKDSNGNDLSVGDEVLEVGAPVNEAGKVVNLGKAQGSSAVEVEWTHDAEGDILDAPARVWYKFSTDLIKVWGREPDGSFIVQQ